MKSCSICFVAPERGFASLGHAPFPVLISRTQKSGKGRLVTPTVVRRGARYDSARHAVAVLQEDCGAGRAVAAEARPAGEVGQGEDGRSSRTAWEAEEGV